MTEHDDLLLTGSVRDALEASLELDGLAVRCRVRDGAVVLFGQLANCEDRERAARITAHVTGVLTVRNELTIRVSGEDALVADAELAARIVAALAEADVDARAVSVEVVHHLVRLGGHTSSESERAVVRHAVGSLSGVVFVENVITIDEGVRVLEAGRGAGSGARTVSG